MTLDDVQHVEELTADAFYELEVATRAADWPPPQRRSPERVEPWKMRIRHLVKHDGDGCWVADNDGVIVGAAAALRRGDFWGLSTFAVRPVRQSRGIGRELLEAALSHGRDDCPAMVCSSHDPRAARRYRLAGFHLHPAMLMWGTVSRAAIPAVSNIRAGSADDVELLDAIDRATRGYGHGVDHRLLQSEFELWIYERTHSRAYAYVHPTGGPYLLAGTDTDSAVTVLWAALAESDPASPCGFHNLTAEQEWAVDVGLQAGMELHNRGFLALRSMPPPAPYIPSGHFL